MSGYQPISNPESEPSIEAPMLAGELGPAALATARVEWNRGRAQATQVGHSHFQEIYQIIRYHRATRLRSPLLFK